MSEENMSSSQFAWFHGSRDNVLSVVNCRQILLTYGNVLPSVRSYGVQWRLKAFSASVSYANRLLGYIRDLLKTPSHTLLRSCLTN